PKCLPSCGPSSEGAPVRMSSICSRASSGRVPTAHSEPAVLSAPGLCWEALDGCPDWELPPCPPPALSSSPKRPSWLAPASARATNTPPIVPYLPALGPLFFRAILASYTGQGGASDSPG